MFHALPPPVMPTVALQLEAPSACGSTADFPSDLLRKGVRVQSDALGRAAVQLRAQPGRWVLEIRYADGTGGQEHRVLEDARCEPLLRSAASMIAVWSGVLGRPRTTPPPPPHSVAEAPREQVIPLSVSAGLRPHVWTHAGVLGLGLESQVHLRFTARSMLEEVRVGAGVGRVELSQGTLTSLYLPVAACPNALLQRPLRVQLCARGEVGLMQSAGTLQAQNESHTRPWLALGPELSAEGSLGRGMHLGAWSAAFWTPVQDRYTVDTQSVHGPASWGLRAGLQLRVGRP